MAAYARTPGSLVDDKMSVMAQAKPVIISPPPPPNTNGYTDNRALASVTTIERDKTANSLSDKISASLQLNSSCSSRLSSNTNNQVSVKLDAEPKVKFIEDDSVIQKQNASNQMRQAAVMAAVASQQKVRLSATERLALTAKRPAVQPPVPAKPASVHVHSRLQAQLQPKSQSQVQVQRQVDSNQSTSMTNMSRAAPMPTLETLLAVQRQLQQHTKQRLNDSAPQQANLTQQQGQIASNKSEQCLLRNLYKQPQQQYADGKPLPPSPPKTPDTNGKMRLNKVNFQSSDTYEKDLPPLPPSISPSTSTDDSQLNSLESHQSSPATSLVSLPPPPPPLSSYLQQYDEVNGCHRTSSSSSPSTASTCEISSVKQFPVSNQQQQMSNSSQQTQVNLEYNKLDSPVPFKTLTRPMLQVSAKPTLNMSSNLVDLTNNQPQPTAQMKKTASEIQPNQLTSGILRTSDLNQLPATQYKRVQQNELTKTYQSKSFTNLPYQRVMSQPPPPPPPPVLSVQLQQDQKVHHEMDSNCQSFTSSGMSKLNSSPAFIPPPPPPLSMSEFDESSGLDELDSGNFRFPTPPPPEMLLRDDCTSGSDHDRNDDHGVVPDVGITDDQETTNKKLFYGINNTDLDVDNDEIHGERENEDDFQCRIPTPPPHKSMPVNSYSNVASKQQSIRNQLQPLVEQKSMAVFDASTFSAPSMHLGLQPPPLFRQQQHSLQQQPLGQPQAHLLQQHQQHQQAHYRQQSLQQTSKPSLHPQLTVYINNDGGGLLSTAPVNSIGQQLDASQAGSNQLHQLQHHHMMMTMTTSSSSPSSSSDCDGQSSNSSSSTSGIHSSIESPSLSSSNDFNYSSKTLMKITKNGLNGTASSRFSSKPSTKHEASGRGSSVKGVCMNADMVGNTKAEIAITSAATTLVQATKPRPALKQKKTVSFSDKVELVACFEEQTEDHLPNPLLARVLAGKSQ